MRLKRLMSIVLVVTLAMSFAMSASAATLYYKQDFSTYADSTELAAAISTVDTTINFYSGSIDVATFKAGGKSMALAGPNNGRSVAIGNATSGNKFVESGTAAAYGQLFFLPTNEWIAKEGEAYVIAFDFERNDADTLTGYNYMGIVGSTGSAYMTSPMVGYHKAGNLISQYTGHMNYGTTGAAGSGHSTLGNGTKPIAFKFEKNSNGGLLRSAYTNDSDGVYSCYYAGATYGIDTYTSIAGFGMNARTTNPGIGNIRMYTINTANGFNVTSSVDGTKVTDLSAKAVTLKFTHPVYEAEFNTNAITVTANGEVVEGVTFGDLTTDVIDGEYVSTIDVTLPALEEAKDYVITVDDTVKNEVADTLVDNTVSFSTPKPDITATITTNSHVKGSMGEATVVVTNNHTTNSKDVAVIYAVYSNAGKLLDVVYANDRVEATKTTTISAGVKLGNDAAKAKVMLWDGISTISPLTGFTYAEVTAAQ